MNIPQIVYLLIHEHFTCFFLFLITMNKLRIVVCKSFKYSHGLYSRPMFHILRNFQVVYENVCSILHSPITIPFFLHSLWSALFILAILIVVSGTLLWFYFAFI